MGITGLLPFLQESSKNCHISEFKGCSVAIDSYCWLHRGAFGCADKLFRGEDTDLFVKYCLKYIKVLQDNSIKPILVFDGQHLPAKRETEKKRREQRKAARSRGNELLRLGKANEARHYFQRCIDINHEMALALIKECRRQGIDCIVAPYEADAQLAFLNVEGIVDFVITEDSDLVLFGCKKILFKFGLDGYGTLVEHEKLIKSMKVRPEEYTFDKFRYMCIMSGCDYLDSLPGIGLKKAHKAVTMTQDPNIYNLLPRLPRYLNINKLVVPPEYIENFKLADATLRHQVIFNPISRQLQRLTDPETSGTSFEHLKNAGQMYNCDNALQMALGNIDPISHKVMDDWNPDAINLNTTSIWSRNFNKSPLINKIRKIDRRVTSFKTVVANVTIESIKKQIFSNSSEQEMSDYDKKLMEEINMYKNSELPVSKPAVKPIKEKIKEVNTTKLIRVNPFLKFNSTHAKKLPKEEPTKEEDVEESCDLDVEPESPRITDNESYKFKPKKLSKFDMTVIEDKVCVKSRFFAKNKNLPENSSNGNKRKINHLSDDEPEIIKSEELNNDDKERSLSPILSCSTLKNKFDLIEINDDSCENSELTTNEVKNKMDPNLQQNNIKVINFGRQTCRQIGLSKKRKKGPNQPTLLTMFSKMKSNTNI